MRSINRGQPLYRRLECRYRSGRQSRRLLAVHPGPRQRPLDGLVECRHSDAGKAQGIIAGGSPACIGTPRLRHHADEVESPARRASAVTPAACHRDTAAEVVPNTAEAGSYANVEPPRTWPGARIPAKSPSGLGTGHSAPLGLAAMAISPSRPKPRFVLSAGVFALSRRKIMRVNGPWGAHTSACGYYRESTEVICPLGPIY
jgi:hypothetical protein